MTHLKEFREIWCVDFEFTAPEGERPAPICMVATELQSGKTLRLAPDRLSEMTRAPFSTGADVLFVAFFASAELGCFLALGWPLPKRVLDLYVEFRERTNDHAGVGRASLLAAMSYYGLRSIDVVEKEEMRKLAMRGGPYEDHEMVALITYCESDVVALGKLLKAMSHHIDLPRALLRGRYMAAVAHMEWEGVPIDVETMRDLSAHWDAIRVDLIHEIDRDYGVYVEGKDGNKIPSFSVSAFEQYLVKSGTHWPRLASGRLALDDDTFRDGAKRYPRLTPLRELRQALSTMRLFDDLAVGADGRNRCLLSPFRARTSRNAPSNARFIFGASSWLRSLIRSAPGMAVAYIDWSQQEFAIAGALSGDQAMMDAYESGDPYLEFAKQAGAVPPDATKASHPGERELYKQCGLAVQYGMSEWGLSHKIGQSLAHAKALLEAHRRTYRDYWRWSQAAIDHAVLHGYLYTVFGWRIRVDGPINARSIANFPVQANGAEMLRIACCLATERGIRVCAPIHDALLVEGPIDEIDQVVVDTQAAMAEASEIVLDGFKLRSDANVVRYPDRYSDPRGEKMWSTVMGLLQKRLTL